MKVLSPEETGDRYNLIANSFEEERSSMIGLDFLQEFLHFLNSRCVFSSSTSILDIGCGTGLPLTKQLASSGATVTGIDVSAEMILKARKNVPEAAYIEGDVLTTKFKESFDGILAWDSLFHIPFDKQEQAVRKIAGLLKPKGVFLFTAGGKAGEFVSCMFETEFYYSSLSPERYASILSEENCLVILNEIDDPRSNGHRVICCRKRE